MLSSITGRSGRFVDQLSFVFTSPSIMPQVHVMVVSRTAMMLRDDSVQPEPPVHNFAALLQKSAVPTQGISLDSLGGTVMQHL